MRKLMLAAAMAFALPIGGCVTDGIGTTIKSVFGFTISQQQLDAARASYDGLILAPAAHYRALPTCRVGQSFFANRCKQWVVVVKLQAADKTVETAFNRVQASITAGNNSGAIAAYETLQTAVTAAQGLIADYGLSGL